MKCKIDDCDRDATYIEQAVCQKHYFRFMRNGYYELKRTADRAKYDRGGCRYRQQNPAGYQRIYEPEHLLSGDSGYVYEHRFVYCEEVDSNPTNCKLCNDPIDWSTCHIDHIDEDVSNNKKDNLRALCRPCNVFRGHTSESMGKYIFEIDGKRMTAFAWARREDVAVCGQTILRRKKQQGMSDYDCIYSERITHHKTKTKKQTAKFDDIRGISNTSVNN